MGLDLYAGPVTRYLAGDWLTILQQMGEANGIDVVVSRPNEPADAVREGPLARVRPILPSSRARGRPARFVHRWPVVSPRPSRQWPRLD